MDKKLNKIVETFFIDFKNHVRDLIVIEDFDKEKTTEIIENIYNYQRLEFTKEDVSKRKRIKNSIPCLNRCTAKRANGEQCTRKQKDGYTFCGTHVKGTPHGIICQDEAIETQVIKGEVFAQDIHGIIYYVDKFGNVYKTEDVLNSKQDPEIVAKTTVINGVYSLPKINK